MDDNDQDLRAQSDANLLDVADEGVTVLLPVAFQCIFIGKLITAQLQSNLKTVAAQIVEILHPCNKTDINIKNLHRPHLPSMFLLAMTKHKT